MSAGSLHDQFTAELERAAARVTATIDGLTDEDASCPAEDGWSVKDHLNHIMFWHEMRFFEISRIGRGGQAAFPPSDEEGVTPLNERMVANRRQLTLPQVLADLEFAREMVKQAVLACPEDRLDQRLYQEIGIQGGAAHEIEHAGLIEAWRKREGI